MSYVFLDTVGMIALWDEDDQWHEDALAAYQLIEAARLRPVTTSTVFLECGNAASRRTYRGDVIELRKSLKDRGAVITPTELEVDFAWHNFAQGRQGGPSIVDCLSFTIMRRLGIRQAFTNDQHFTDAGFETLF